MMRTPRWSGRMFVASLAMLLATTASAGQLRVLKVPHRGQGLDFDDIGYAPSLHRVLVPAAQSGALALIDPDNQHLAEWRDLVPKGSGADREDAGTTSAAVGQGLVLLSDHQDQAVLAIDPRTHHAVARASLAAGPDYVRYVAPLHQVWVTEPRARQIERFALTAGKHPALSRVGAISVPGGPESLVIDADHDVAYTNEWGGHAVRIDLRQLRVTARWADSCKGSRGLALAPHRHLLFVGCKEGKVIALDTAHQGRIVSHAAVGVGVDIIAWNPHLQHLYVPAARSATLTVLALRHGRRLQPVATLPAAPHAHCVATDGEEHAYVCDPGHGAIMVYRDHADH